MPIFGNVQSHTLTSSVNPLAPVVQLDEDPASRRLLEVTGEPTGEGELPAGARGCVSGDGSD